VVILSLCLGAATFITSFVVKIMSPKVRSAVQNGGNRKVSAIKSGGNQHSVRQVSDEQLTSFEENCLGGSFQEPFPGGVSTRVKVSSRTRCRVPGTPPAHTLAMATPVA
jgi:hypothetical protein